MGELHDEDAPRLQEARLWGEGAEEVGATGDGKGEGRAQAYGRSPPPDGEARRRERRRHGGGAGGKERGPWRASGRTWRGIGGTIGCAGGEMKWPRPREQPSHTQAQESSIPNARILQGPSTGELNRYVGTLTEDLVAHLGAKGGDRRGARCDDTHPHSSPQHSPSLKRGS